MNKHNLTSSSGRIIVVTGGQRVGKSTLVRLLSGKLNAAAFYEGEEKDIPRKIIEGFAKGKNMLEATLWFRNRYVEQYLNAIELRNGGKTVVMDNFHLINEVYVEAWVEVEFEREILKKMVDIDANLLPWPDAIVSLSADRGTVRKFMTIGGRSYEDEEYFERVIHFNKVYEKWISGFKKENIVCLKRDDMDFNMDADLDKLTRLVKDVK